MTLLYKNITLLIYLFYLSYCFTVFIEGFFYVSNGTAKKIYSMGSINNRYLKK